MTPDRLGELWQETLKNKALLGRILEDTIEFFYYRWLRPGDVAIDVGANVGRHTFPMARAVGEDGKVLAFEAAPLMEQALRASLERSPIKQRVHLQHAAVCDRIGREEFGFVATEPALSSLKLRENISRGRTDIQYVTVPTTTLDAAYPTGDVRFIKMDVEGAEFLVFRGSQSLMSRASPIFAFEDGRMGTAITFGYKMKEFYQFFCDQDYVVLDTFGFAVNDAMTRYGGPWNFFAVPKKNQTEVSEIILLSVLKAIFGRFEASP